MIQPYISRHSRTRDVLHGIETGRRPGTAPVRLLDSWNQDIGTGALDADRLGLELDQHLRRFALRQPGHRAARLVWQCALRADPGGPSVPDSRFTLTCRDVLHATGIAPAGEPEVCRWALIRVSAYEARIVATLMTARGQVHETAASRPLALAVCQLFDRRHGPSSRASALSVAATPTGRRR
ncbi:hypothetical protein ABH940_005576 [Streptacidiphilus sp. BW17]|uniref:hypothetical protein n=1 Tax=Streptacidiphilus sp. BW17 TaxID=3156274 RepID=UPI00351812E5